MQESDVAVIGAGIVGIAVVSYLKKAAPTLSVVLIDRDAPMSLTSAQSGENYRNWWPHPVMKQFTDDSIDLMEEWARETDDAIQLTRRGYILASRKANVEALMAELLCGYGDDTKEIRVHDDAATPAYAAAISAAWQDAPSGVDVLTGSEAISQAFPWIDPEISTLVHIRRAGAVASQQLGQFMLELYRDHGGERLKGDVTAIDQAAGFVLSLDGGTTKLRAGQIVNAAGPFLNDIAAMVGVSLPVSNVLQQKIAFEDTEGAISRQMPFVIDLDPQEIDWSGEERALLRDEPELKWLAEQMPGAIHCRPDGGDVGRWVKLGWAFNETETDAVLEPALLDHFPEIVLRGAARLSPALKTYYGRLPRNRRHYGGFYTQTDENWPLIGPMGVAGTFVAGAMSGFGTMAACGTGALTANWVLGNELPEYAAALSPARTADSELMAALRAQNSRGML